MTMRISIPDFLTVFDAYCAAKGIGEQRASYIVLKAGHRVGDIRRGGDIGVNTLTRALQFMSDDWPPSRRNVWPAGVPRPRKSPEKQTEAALAR